MATDTVYRGSDGNYYGDADIWERFEAGDWTPCCWDADSGAEWVETDSGGLLALEPIPRRKLPGDVAIERVGGGCSVTAAEPLTCR